MPDITEEPTPLEEDFEIELEGPDMAPTELKVRMQLAEMKNKFRWREWDKEPPPADAWVLAYRSQFVCEMVHPSHRDPTFKYWRFLDDPHANPASSVMTLEERARFYEDRKYGVLTEEMAFSMHGIQSPEYIAQVKAVAKEVSSRPFQGSVVAQQDHGEEDWVGDELEYRTGPPTPELMEEFHAMVNGAEGLPFELSPTTKDCPDPTAE